MTMRILFGLFVFLVSSSTFAQDTDQFFGDRQRGWFYHEPIPDDLVPPKPPVSQGQPQDPASSGPKPLSVEWMKANLEKYMSRAIDDPSPENIRDYLWLQRYAMDKGQRFSSSVQRLMYQDLDLDPSRAEPSWSSARSLGASDSRSERAKVLRSIGQQYGIWFFFKSDCSYCHLHAPVLANFARSHGYTVLPISIDGKDMPQDPFPRFVSDKGQANMLGVQVTPTMFLVKPPSTFIPLGQTAMSVREMETRVIELAADKGIITTAQYESLSGGNRTWLPPVDQLPGLTDIGDNPGDVSRFLRDVSRGQGSDSK